MSESRLVTVIIPCYNHAQFLGEAISSVLDQGYPNLEVIVVDDGSDDETVEVAGSYEEVKCISQANQGLARARNRGLRVSRGEYILFLDADDRLVEGALREGADTLDTHPDCAFVYGNVRLIDANGSLLFNPPSVNIERDHYLELLRHNHIWSPGAVMYRRIVFDAIGLSAFAIQGAIAATSMNHPISTVIVAAILTGIGGGMIRDVLAGRKPVVLREEIYAVWALLGGLVVGLNMVNSTVEYMILFISLVVFRMLSLKLNWKLPHRAL